MINIDNKQILTMAHRGLPSLYPENTLLSFQKSLDFKPDILELDIRLTKDEIPVVIHDELIDRTTVGLGLVCNYYWKDLKEFDTRMGNNIFEEKIPRLDDFMQFIGKKDLLLNIEIKDNNTKCADLVLDIIKNYLYLDRSVITCFDARILRYLKSKNNEISVQGFPANEICDFAQYKNIYYLFDYVGININMATKDIVNFFNQQNIITGVWCIDTLEDMQKALKLEIKIITTNKIDILEDMVGEYLKFK